ncbi:MAG: cell surface protein SprA, partial [Cytophagales bacterium]|nr:cell surface protein SprA [Cytophagales bacterium]
MKSTEGIVVAIFAGSALSLLTWMSDAHSNKVDKRLLQENLNFLMLPDDTTKDTKNEKYKPSTRPTFKLKDRYGDPTSNRPSKSPLLLKDPPNINQKIELGDDGKSFDIQEKVGNVDYRPPTRMNYKQFTKLRNQEMMQNYWKATSAGKDAETATGTKSLIPKIYMSPILDRIFGGNTIDVKPNGTIMLDFGGRYQRTDNPSIPVQQQRVGQFWFDQQIAFNLQAKVGERLTLRANWDTKATFDFDNNIKLQYKAQEEDIIQNIEAGNVSMPSGTTLIQGAQNLFGVKAYLRFGKLWITAVGANQRGKTDELVIPGGTGGALSKENEIRADNYEDNRHYFLSQFFRDNYEKSLGTLPYILSGVNITRVEVYVTNRNNTTSTLRNIVAFTDLGEKHPIDSLGNALPTASKGPYASNDANTLYNRVKVDPVVRNSTDAQSLGAVYNYQQGTNFEVVRGARKLEENKDFTINKQLGYISLNSPLRNDDVLAVSFQYSNSDGAALQVGEMTEDYQRLPESQNAIFKLLRPTI